MIWELLVPFPFGTHPVEPSCCYTPHLWKIMCSLFPTLPLLPDPFVSVMCLVLVGIRGQGLRLRTASTHQALCTHLIRYQVAFVLVHYACSPAHCLKPFVCRHLNLSHLSKLLSSTVSFRATIEALLDLPKSTTHPHCALPHIPFTPTQPDSVVENFGLLAIIVAIFQNKNLERY